MNAADNRYYTKYTPGSLAVAGIIAGLGMFLILCLVSAGLGTGFWLPVQTASGIFYGPMSILGGAGPTILGLLTIVVTSAILGAVFSYFLRADQTGSSQVISGLVFGVIVWALASYIGMPILNPTMSERMALVPGWWFIANLAFGAILGAVPASAKTRTHTRFEDVSERSDRRAA
jgi:hypothetical protein